MEEKSKNCFVPQCNQPVIGGRITDDGLQIHFCEFHFAEDFLALIDSDSEATENDKNKAIEELGKILMTTLSDITQAPKIWN